MKRWAVVFLAVLLVFAGSGVPSPAWAAGWHGGGRHRGWDGSGGHGGWHGGGWHGGCCWGGWWWPGAVVGGLALGAAYPYPYYYDYYAPPPAVYEQAPADAAPPAPPIQREVVYPTGKYVLYGDGANQAYQWVWMPAARLPHRRLRRGKFPECEARASLDPAARTKVPAGV